MDQSTPDTNNGVHQVISFNNSLLVALSTADTNKWSTLLERREWTPKSEATPLDYERTGPIRQRQRRLTDAQALILRDRYDEGATVYELAKEFGIRRAAVSERLKKAGVSMRCQPPRNVLINSMAGLYESGLSLAEVGARTGISPGTVRRYLFIRGVKMRDSHGRIRSEVGPINRPAQNRCAPWRQ